MFQDKLRVAVQVTTCRGWGHIVSVALKAVQLVMSPPLIGGALSDAFV